VKLSVIIPTLNEEAFLGPTLKALKNYTQQVPEIIVVDAGSSDSTREIALEHGVNFIQDPRLKGRKYSTLNLGAHEAAGDVFLFLDAETRVPFNDTSLIKYALTDHQLVGGAFSFQFNRDGWKYRMVEVLNTFRMRVRQRFYGDQGVFVRKEAFYNIKGFPEAPLLETAYFCKQLKKEGKLVLLPASSTTSARRFEQDGFWQTL
jgi:rSAM/selenodomain-associated transferase 2